MEQAANIFNIAFIAVLVMGIVFLIISVVLFFVFDIKTIYSIRSGRAEAKAIKEMSQANAQSGRLRTVNNIKRENASSYKSYGSDAPIAPKTNFENVSDENKGGVRDLDSLNKAGTAADSSGSDETNVLPSDTQETQLLPTPAGETVLSNDAAYGKTDMLKKDSKQKVDTESLDKTDNSGNEFIMTLEELNFDVVKKVVSTFTDEVIY